VFNRIFGLLLVLLLTLGSVGCYRSVSTVRQATPQPTAPSPKPSEQPVPPPTPNVGRGQPTTPPLPVTTPSTSTSSLQEFIPFRDAGTVRSAISSPSVVTYRVVNVGATEHSDLSVYLDDLMAKSNWPGPNDLVLVVFAGHNHDIRFGLGNLFRQKGVTVEEILGLVRTHYLPEAIKGQPELGIADLVGAINRRMN